MAVLRFGPTRPNPGRAPSAAPTLDAAGGLYGTTYQGGSGNLGTVFELPVGGSAPVTLASFNYADGAQPMAGLIADAAGYLYGTTASGGTSGDGTVFEVLAGSRAVVTLATFNGSDGSTPEAGLIVDAAGNLYGTTDDGSTVFELSGTGFVTAVPEPGPHPLAVAVAAVAVIGRRPRRASRPMFAGLVPQS